MNSRADNAYEETLQPLRQRDAKTGAPKPAFSAPEYGQLLTTSSILVNAALRDANFQSFQLLDFLPVGGAMAVAGLLFMTFLGIARRTALHTESAEVALTCRL